MSVVKRFALVGSVLGLVLAPAGAAQAAQLSEQDRHYLEQAHQSNLAEIAVGELAQQRGNSQHVRALFISTQLVAHVMAMQAGATEIEQGSNERVIQLAREAAPVLESHHEGLQAAAEALGLPAHVDAGSGGQAASAASNPAGVAWLAGGLLVLAVASFLGWARLTRAAA